jgi:2-oxoglutarate ferredoxin oxidoreductase subunit alpha
MQLTGGQFTLSTALAGNDLATFPDFPAEIRAPQGTTFGVSAFQINFGSTAIETAGDQPDVLVAMNPAALKTNVGALKEGGLIIADEGEFGPRNLAKAGYEVSPLTDGSLAKWQLLAFNISQLTLESVKPFGLGNKEALRCKNMWTLGLALWMFDRDREPLVAWLKEKFAKNPTLAEANIAALNAGHAYGETAELSGPLKQHHIAPAPAEPGLYRTITGAESISLGLVAGAQLAGIKMFFGGYPITPASAILHHLSRLKEYEVTTFQAEDEIAAIASAIGASYAGQLGVTSSSGPGIALKTEAMGLAVMTELPLVIVNSQRGGPSTGLPTKTEQSDLYQSVYGLRLRDRGGADRDPVHDPGDPAHGRLYRQCRRALEGAGHVGLCALPGEVPGGSSRGRVQALWTRREARPALGEARHARPHPPHRRHREAGRYRPHRLFARQPPGDDRYPSGQGQWRRRSCSGSGGRARQ